MNGLMDGRRKEEGARRTADSGRHATEGMKDDAITGAITVIPSFLVLPGPSWSFLVSLLRI